MATSTVARKMAGLLSIVFLLGMANAQANAVNTQFAGFVVPTNATLPTVETMTESVLTLSGGPLFDGKVYNVAPLTEQVGKGGSTTMLSQIHIAGLFKSADYSNTGNLTSGDIALINCDPDGGNIDPSTVVGAACMISPAVRAIVLYSLAYNACNLTQNYNYTSIFTMISRNDSADLMSTAALYPPSTSILNAIIGPNNSTSGNGNQNPAGTSNEGGPAPTTAVAMSILYSITGIITLLFLIIIATGALRAHRHPERYGPRTGVTGRPRQSRAKGIARAMLESLPIVKFGDPEPVKPGARDIELEDGRSTPNAVAKEHAEGETPVESGLNPATADSIHSGKESTEAKEGLGCSICTEDFQAGEDVRVLPCDHKYHPACIDPWLLNVSGTCPLCRHDLRPVRSNTSEHPSTDVNAGEAAASVNEAELPPPLEPEEGVANNTSTRRRSRFLDLHRLRHAPAEERIAALRQLREQSQQEGEGQSPIAAAGERNGDSSGVVAAEEQSRRARVTGRLRNVFGVRTRTAPAPVLQTRSATTAPAFSAYGLTRSI